MSIAKQNGSMKKEHKQWLSDHKKWRTGHKKILNNLKKLAKAVSSHSKDMKKIANDVKKHEKLMHNGRNGKRSNPLQSKYKNGHHKQKLRHQLHTKANLGILQVNKAIERAVKRLNHC